MTTTSLSPYLGVNLLNVDDFFQSTSILHPFAIGSIAIAALFIYLRLSSNRTVAPFNLWDKIVSVALGSTLAGIINGNSLTRGLLALFVLLAWQYASSSLSTFFPKTLAFAFTNPPLVVAFRGRLLEGVMRKNRITPLDIYGALRQRGITNICELECVIVEPTGAFSVYLCRDMPKDFDPEILLAVDGYQRLVKHDEQEKQEQRDSGRDGEPKPAEDETSKKKRDDIANDAA